MKPLTFITDEIHNRRYVPIDLAEVADIDEPVRSCYGYNYCRSPERR